MFHYFLFFYYEWVGTYLKNVYIFFSIASCNLVMLIFLKANRKLNYSKKKDICDVANTVGTWLSFRFGFFSGCFHRLNFQLVIVTAVKRDLNGPMSCAVLKFGFPPTGLSLAKQ